MFIGIDIFLIPPVSMAAGIPSNKVCIKNMSLLDRFVKLADGCGLALIPHSLAQFSLPQYLPKPCYCQHLGCSAWRSRSMRSCLARLCCSIRSARYISIHFSSLKGPIPHQLSVLHWLHSPFP